MIVPKCMPSPSRSQDSLYSCLVCFCATISYTIVLGSQYSFGVLFVAFLEKFGESRQKTAWIGSLSFCLATILGPVVSLLNKKLSCRAMSIIGHVIIMTGLLISSYVTEMDYLFLTYGVLTGAGISLPLLTDNVVIAQYFNKYRSLANSALGMGASIGYLSMNPIIRFILKETDLSTCFQILCALHLVPCLLAITFDPNVESDSDKNEKWHEKENNKRELEEDPIKLTYCSVFNNYPVVVVLVAFFLFEFGHLIPYIHLVKHCQDLGISQDNGAKLYIYFGISSIVGRMMAGLLADTFHFSKIFIVQWGSFYPMGILTLILPLIKSYDGLIIHMVLYGFTDGLCIATYNCLLYDLAGPKQHTQAVGLVFFAMSIPLAVSPPFAGFLADETGSYDIAFYLVGCFIVLAGLSLNLIRCFNKTSTREETDIDSVSDYELFVTERETVL